MRVSPRFLLPLFLLVSTPLAAQLSTATKLLLVGQYLKKSDSRTALETLYTIPPADRDELYWASSLQVWESFITDDVRRTVSNQQYHSAASALEMRDIFKRLDQTVVAVDSTTANVERLLKLHPFNSALVDRLASQTELKKKILSYKESYLEYLNTYKSGKFRGTAPESTGEIVITFDKDLNIKAEGSFHFERNIDLDIHEIGYIYASKFIIEGTVISAEMTYANNLTLHGSLRYSLKGLDDDVVTPAYYVIDQLTFSSSNSLEFDWGHDFQVMRKKKLKGKKLFVFSHLVKSQDNYIPWPMYFKLQKLN